MAFTSANFILFVVVLMVLYYGPCKKWQWQTLLVANYFFYYFSGAINLIYILATTITTYFIVKKIGQISDDCDAFIKAHKQDMERDERKAYKAKEKKKMKGLLTLTICINIGMLAVIKYTNFMISNVNAVRTAFNLGQPISYWDIMLPMGISFYIFQTVGYSIDVYRGKIKAETNPFKLATFISFFPQLVQGPISRFDELTATLFAKHDLDYATIRSGALRVLWGFFKKLVIADRLLVAVTTIIGDTDTYYGSFVFVGMVFYAIELYADFTGGIDITIGTAELLGIKLAENFVRPYFSKNIKEFWNRWHITMGSWFTDYIFYPISVSQGMLKLSKKSRARLGEQLGKRVPVYLSSFIVWFATGIWHGASWNFIVWGLGNFVVIMISQELAPFYRWFHGKFAIEGKPMWQFFQIVRTMLIVASLRTFDCYRNVPLTFKMFGTMFTNMNWGYVGANFGSLGLTLADYIVVIVGTVIMFSVSIIGGDDRLIRAKLFEKKYWIRFTVIFALFLAVILFGSYGVGYDSSQFIYNQF